jgi:hypothetical protein
MDGQRPLMRMPLAARQTRQRRLANNFLQRDARRSCNTRNGRIVVNPDSPYLRLGHDCHTVSYTRPSPLEIVIDFRSTLVGVRGDLGRQIRQGAHLG